MKVARLACLLAFVCPLWSCRPPTDRTLEEMFDHTYPIEPTGNLSITNRDGSIRVYAAGKTRDIRVEAIKRAYSAERLKAVSIQVTARPDSLSIETIYPPDSSAGFTDRSGTVDYVIVVPQTIHISKLELGNGELLVEGMRSDQARAQLGNGRLYANNCFGNLELALHTGNLVIVYEWWEQHDFAIRTSVQNGHTLAYIPSEAAFHIVAQTATGKIVNDFAEKEERRAEPVNKIDMLVGGGGKTTFQFETQDGNVKIAEHSP